ncbi:PREDICTED: protein phosphatase Slingshot homolog 1-like [Branchiostoma belcheri]|uniref:protein-serine/threonine phosphatase n=1 Tax=Branchiostoma belcheri TaxID=7741 RepID=A0A6P4Y6D5_BRABE|nr:PREDICTED: protein phosphatase Slingshot homolog 1-like [Branchiostoma belcheri]
MSLVTVQRSPTPSNSGSSSGSVEDADDESEEKRLKRTHSLCESYVAIKDCVLILPQSDNVQRPARSTKGGDLQNHLQSMFYLLRPQDTIKLAVKLESAYPDRIRYMAIVSCFGREDTEESIILGIDFQDRSAEASVGLVLPIWSNTKVVLDGDGGFSVSSHGRYFIFKPVSVQAMWSALQSLHKVAAIAREYNYFDGSIFLTWTGYYSNRISSNQSCVKEWHILDDLMCHRPESPSLYGDRPTEKVLTERNIRKFLKMVMMQVDLENVTSKQVRQQVEKKMNTNLHDFRGYIDQEMIIILGQMDAASEIFEHLYLGSEWNASNLEELQQNGVGYILNVTREIDNFYPGMFDYCNVRVYDEEDSELLSHWNRTYEYIEKAKRMGSKCLVHCKMGVSRSASTVIAYAMKEYNMTMQDAYNYVKSIRSCIKPNSAFMQQLEEYQGILDASNQRHNKLWRQPTQEQPTSATTEGDKSDHTDTESVDSVELEVFTTSTPKMDQSADPQVAREMEVSSMANLENIEGSGSEEEEGREGSGEEDAGSSSDLDVTLEVTSEETHSAAEKENPANGRTAEVATLRTAEVATLEPGEGEEQKPSRSDSEAEEDDDTVPSYKVDFFSLMEKFNRPTSPRRESRRKSFSSLGRKGSQRSWSENDRLSQTCPELVSVTPVKTKVQPPQRADPAPDMAEGLECREDKGQGSQVEGQVTAGVVVAANVVVGSAGLVEGQVAGEAAAGHAGASGGPAAAAGQQVDSGEQAGIEEYQRSLSQPPKASAEAHVLDFDPKVMSVREIVSGFELQTGGAVTTEISTTTAPATPAAGRKVRPTSMPKDDHSWIRDIVQWCSEMKGDPSLGSDRPRAFSESPALAVSEETTRRKSEWRQSCEDLKNSRSYSDPDVRTPRNVAFPDAEDNHHGMEQQREKVSSLRTKSDPKSSASASSSAERPLLRVENVSGTSVGPAKQPSATQQDLAKTTGPAQTTVLEPAGDQQSSSLAWKPGVVKQQKQQIERRFGAGSWSEGQESSSSGPESKAAEQGANKQEELDRPENKTNDLVAKSSEVLPRNLPTRPVTILETSDPPTARPTSLPVGKEEESSRDENVMLQSGIVKKHKDGFEQRWRLSVGSNYEELASSMETSGTTVEKSLPLVEDKGPLASAYPAENIPWFVGAVKQQKGVIETRKVVTPTEPRPDSVDGAPFAPSTPTAEELSSSSEEGIVKKRTRELEALSSSDVSNTMKKSASATGLSDRVTTLKDADDSRRSSTQSLEDFQAFSTRSESAPENLRYCVSEKSSPVGSPTKSDGGAAEDVSVRVLVSIFDKSKEAEDATKTLERQHAEVERSKSFSEGQTEQNSSEKENHQFQTAKPLVRTRPRLGADSNPPVVLSNRKTRQYSRNHPVSRLRKDRKQRSTNPFYNTM